MPELLARRGFARYALLTTERAEPAAPALAEGAEVVLHVPAGAVPDAAAAVRSGVDGRPLVALGGGRVVDAAKAIAGADGLACAAVPTTLAGSPMTPFHRMPAGVRAAQLVRPALVAWDPELIASLSRAQLAATGLNALAHAFESLYAPLANPVCELAALRAAGLLGAQLARADPDVEEVALGALLAGYAVGATGFAVHHALCQTAVRTLALPHAATNAVVLAHTTALMAARAPEPVGRFAAALGDPAGDPAGAPARVARLTAATAVDGLAGLGVEPEALPALARAALEHPAMARTPGGAPSEAELLQVLRAAL
jgi:maleylacetate reductase